jgi:N-acetylglucosaminyldiphosphoundecaprenol N-acetyl-beta-D-mannosaminyltransferase
LLFWGDAIIHAWVGRNIAAESKTILPIVVLSSAALGLSVTGSYTMLALRRVQSVAWLNVAGGAMMLCVIAWLLPRDGIGAIATGRFLYGFITLLIYLPLAFLLWSGSAQAKRVSRGRSPFIGIPDKSTKDPDTRIHYCPERIAPFRTYANVLSVQVEALNMERALARIKDALVEKSKGYVCMAGVHGIMEAQRNANVGYAYADAMMTLPDGRPTVWVGRSQGHRSMRQVTGPDLMLEVFRQREFAEYSHFLYGGKQGIAEELAENLTRQFPWARIAGTYTPPFRDLTAAEAEDLINRLRYLKPDIVWVGISTPRQEVFMRNYLPLLDTTLMFGVGAAFDFHTGRIKDCSEWVKRAGLQWLHRLMQDPRHLWWRYLRNNPEFVYKIALQIAGMRTYPASEARIAIENRIYARETPAAD